MHTSLYSMKMDAASYIPIADNLQPRRIKRESKPGLVPAWMNQYRRLVLNFMIHTCQKVMSQSKNCTSLPSSNDQSAVAQRRLSVRIGRLYRCLPHNHGASDLPSLLTEGHILGGCTFIRKILIVKM